MENSQKPPSDSQGSSNVVSGPRANASVHLIENARTDNDTILKGLGSQLEGLSEADADSCRKEIGTNEIAREKRQSALTRLLRNLKNPLVLLLSALGALSFLTGDQRATAVIFAMVVLGVVLRFFQEMRADNAAEKLQAMVSNTATLVRGGKEQEVPLKMLVPGDIIRLAAGDMVPADVRVLSAKDLFLNQVALTGEALPVEKKAAPASADTQNPLELPNICFLGSNVESGAILDHEELKERLKAKDRYRKIDEIPFDFVRRRMSVVVEDETGLNTLICKGAVDEVMSQCTRVELKGQVIPVETEHDTKRQQLADDLNGQGFRVIALAYKEMPGASDEPVYSVKDESDLILIGFLAFLDPPKDTATEALKRLNALDVKVKVLTGDNEIITAFICKEVGMPVEHLLLGSQVEIMSETELAVAASATSVFARLAPAHKERIIRALQSQGHVLGFLGDGINDAPALKAAGVGISVNGAVDIAKESSDIILLETSLLVLEQGVLEGRRVFGNIVKYIKMAASSNFGNMFSVVGASAFLPFLPMLPIQVLTNNLLYDFSQTTIPTDEVDTDWLTKPRQWTISKILRYILFIGPISSIFDYLTFFLMLYVFDCWHNPALFHTGWFVESLFTQTLIIHVIRTNKVPFIQSRASWPLILTSLLVVASGAWLTVSPLASTLGFVPLPSLYWLYLAIMMLCYAVLTQVVKSWFIRRFGE